VNRTYKAVAAVAAAMTLAGLAGCGGTVNEAACADALQKVLRGGAPMAKPSECHGLSDERMGELSFHGSPEAADAAKAQPAASVSDGLTRSLTETVAEARAPHEARTDACRADLERQLVGVTPASTSYDIARTEACDASIGDQELKTLAATIIVTNGAR
jgi:hypothetical protein